MSVSGKSEFRIGQGLDVHAFEDGDHVILCGVRIQHTAGLAAHSDGDVALHALCDSLLGAAALGDIGKHFPPNNPDYEDADSRDLLRAVVDLVIKEGWSVNNVDLTVVCEAPRLGPHIDFMRANIAVDLGIDVSRVSVKATTTEGLGFCGRDEGIAASAIASLVTASDS
jgi:2-C-methyl-D-erythritol 2,4-cyclodiphosphate synthase